MASIDAAALDAAERFVLLNVTIERLKTLRAYDRWSAQDTCHIAVRDTH